MIAKGQLLNQHIQAYGFLSNLPDSPFRTQALSQQQGGILELGRAHQGPVTRESSSILLEAHMVVRQQVGNNQENQPPRSQFVSQENSEEVNPDHQTASLQRILREDLSALDEIIICNICQSQILLGDATMSTPCSHTFHFQCLRPWMMNHSTCPNCRHDLSAPRPDSPDSAIHENEDPG